MSPEAPTREGLRDFLVLGRGARWEEFGSLVAEFARGLRRETAVERRLAEICGTIPEGHGEMRVKVSGSGGEFLGFTRVAELNFDTGGYEWSAIGVWSRDSSGTLWHASDSGCSCTTPWGDTDELERLFNLGPLRAARSAYDGASPEEWDKFLGAVESALDKLRRSR